MEQCRIDFCNVAEEHRASKTHHSVQELCICYRSQLILFNCICFFGRQESITVTRLHYLSFTSKK